MTSIFSVKSKNMQSSSNYLQEIENEFIRIRGKHKFLNPVDWALAQSWEDSGIALHIVLGAMSDVQKSFTAEKRPDKINSLSYFTQAVEKRFAEWQTSQVGKSIAPDTPIFRNTEETKMKNFTVAAQTAQTNVNVEILGAIADNLKPVSNYPEPLASTVAQIRGEILALMTEAEKLDMDEIEAKLAAQRVELETALIASTTDDERAEILKAAQTEFSKFTQMPDVAQKMMVRKLYNKFGLPELTLFAL